MCGLWGHRRSCVTPLSAKQQPIIFHCTAAVKVEINGASGTVIHHSAVNLTTLIPTISMIPAPVCLSKNYPIEVLQ